MTELRFTKQLECKWLASLPYQDGLKIQQQMWEETQQDGNIRIIGCEHPRVATLGKRADFSVDVKDNIRDVEVVATDRGGQATLHNEGQLVVYPIVPLRDLNWGVKDFVATLLECAKELISRRGIEVFSLDNTGLYTKQGKVVFCGLRVDKGISRHGISINLSNNLDDFSVIRSCGSQSNKLDLLSAYHDDFMNSKAIFEEWYDLFDSMIQKKR